MNPENQTEKTEFNVAEIRDWYKQQITLAKLRTELSELMAREAKANAERLHFLGAVASMQVDKPEEVVNNENLSVTK
jgi:hypothetical protein